MNEKISKIKLELLKEEFTKQIKDSYILNLSMVLLEEFEKLQQENQQLKENYERTYNENRALREKDYITDTDLIYENYILSQVIEKAIEYEEEIMYLANKTAITTQNVEIKAIRDRLEEIFEILKGDDNCE